MTEATRLVKMHDILDLVLCIEEFGDNNICIGTLYEWAHPVTDEDIKKYIDSYEGHDEYGIKDLQEYTECLAKWRDYQRTHYLFKLKEQQEEC